MYYSLMKAISEAQKQLYQQKSLFLTLSMYFIHFATYLTNKIQDMENHIKYEVFKYQY